MMWPWSQSEKQRWSSWTFPLSILFILDSGGMLETWLQCRKVEYGGVVGEQIWAVDAQRWWSMGGFLSLMCLAVLKIAELNFSWGRKRGHKFISWFVNPRLKHVNSLYITIWNRYLPRRKLAERGGLRSMKIWEGCSKWDILYDTGRKFEWGFWVSPISPPHNGLFYQGAS